VPLTINNHSDTNNLGSSRNFFATAKKKKKKTKKNGDKAQVIKI